jgi:gamma-glutamyltranspeptidase/glutathione hydrolase
MNRLRRTLVVIGLATALGVLVGASSVPSRAHGGMVVSQNQIASQVGARVLEEGGTAIDAAVATAFALAVVHPSAGNIGGGGFMLYRPSSGKAVTFDFREVAPAKATPTMFLVDGTYQSEVHHNSYLSVGVPGTVAGLHLAWKEGGKLPWRRLVDPAVALARDGFPLSEGLARSLRDVVQGRLMQKSPAAIAQFSKNGTPYVGGETLKQPDLARTLERIAAQGPAGFYDGETARLIEKEMASHGGLITRDDLKNYTARQRTPITGTYRGVEVISVPPPSSGGVAIVEILNVLEGYDLARMGAGSASSIHLMAEAMRRAYADRARYLGDSDFVTDMPIPRLTSKAYADELRKTINPQKASTSTPTSFAWPVESHETTQISVVDAAHNAVSMTYTLEQGFGVKIVVPGAGFLLNNEMGDFNAAPELTNESGLIGTVPNLAAPSKRMLSSMSPTIVAKDGKLFMVTGSPGGRTIINTVLETIVDVVDFGMNAQEAVDAPKFHHQWLPNRITFEKFGFSPDTVAELERRGHVLQTTDSQGVAQVIVVNDKEGVLEGGTDHRAPDSGAVGTRR